MASPLSAILGDPRPPATITPASRRLMDTPVFYGPDGIVLHSASTLLLIAVGLM